MLLLFIFFIYFLYIGINLGGTLYSQPLFLYFTVMQPSIFKPPCYYLIPKFVHTLYLTFTTIYYTSALFMILNFFFSGGGTTFAAPISPYFFK